MKNDFLKIKRLFYCCLKKENTIEFPFYFYIIDCWPTSIQFKWQHALSKEEKTNNDNFNSIKCTDADEILESLCIDLFALE